MEKQIDVSQIIHEFREVIYKSSENVERLAKSANTDSFKSDWLQSCWERLVEQSLSKSEPIRLEVYGEGADINGGSSRISFHEDLPTHQIVCRSKCKLLYDEINERELETYDEQEFLFDRFVTIKDGWYYDESPFDYVVLNTAGTEVIVKIEKVLFVLTKKLF